MSKIKIPIHAVWGTKKRFPFLTDNIRIDVCKHIHENAKKKDIYIDTINGYTDHLHCLFYLNPVIDLRKTIQLMKGESSRWLSLEYSNMKLFQWADDYFAIAVCQSAIPIVRRYIERQPAHHKKMTLEEEMHIIRKKVDWSVGSYEV
jgi:putative transposase